MTLDARPAAPLLEAQGLGVRVRGDRALLQGVDVSARAGEVVGVLGPNGAGKSTLLEAIVGLRDGVSGEVRVSGRPLTTFAERARAFAYMPDDAALPEELSVRAVLGAAAGHDASRRLALGGLLNARAGRLSRGESKRVWLAWTLAQEKPLFLLDEPFGAFDPRQLREVLPVVRTAAERGAAVIATIHQMRTAELVADRLLLLASGRALAFGTLDELRAQVALPGAPLDDVFLALLDAEGADAAS
ncbi:MAG: ABC transporter ATP-binding protein [Polyangiaceae bacterium]|nr:ABC transporter ATP-binding protein [Polyangiaceae bacterium]